jgi:hypothetical protein
MLALSLAGRSRKGKASKTAKLKRLRRSIQNALKLFKNVVFNLVLVFFEDVNEQIRSGFPLFRMKEETSEHLHMLFKALRYVIFPASICFVVIGVLSGQYTMDSVVWGVIIFIYGNFLPDLPSAFREKIGEEKTARLSWFKKYALLLFAPIFIWLLFTDITVAWKTTETFHNFKSLFIFEGFLALLGFLFFGGLLEPLSFCFYGAVGYLAHLKVDKIW